ncbi:MAG TPA: DUF6491 family protein, partial [Gammaproteobacteria bacterium]|nr:DUF6491 family protein [Gammaproteobacteria bacterium]
MGNNHFTGRREPRAARRALAGGTARGRALAALALPACLLVLYGAGAPAQQGSDDRDTRERDCIGYQQIESTDVVDDETILFRMRGRQIYVNDLPNKCPELRAEDRFMYRSSTSQLCSLDTITVLNDIGFGFRPGATCGLGKFVPVDEDAAEQLLQEARGR